MTILLTLLFLLFHSPLQAELVDRIVAIVGEEIITHSDVQSLKSKGEKDPLKSLIRESLFRAEVARAEIEVTNDDIARGIQEVLARNRITLPQLKKELSDHGTSFEEYKESLKKEIQKMKFMGQVIVPRIKVSEEEILKKLGSTPTEEERIRIRQEIVGSRLSPELEVYLDEVREKTYVEIKKP